MISAHFFWCNVFVLNFAFSSNCMKDVGFCFLFVPWVLQSNSTSVLIVLQKGEFCICVRQIQAKIQSHQLHNSGLIFSEFLEPHACQEPISQAVMLAGYLYLQCFQPVCFSTGTLSEHTDFPGAPFLWHFRLPVKSRSQPVLLPGGNGLPNIGVKAVRKRDTVFYDLLCFGFFYSITQKIGK